MELSVEIILTLLMVAVAAGFIDSIAGGGGLLTVPAMLLAGMDPVVTLATNKLQATFGVGSASMSYIRHGATSWRAARGMMAVAACGAMLGALFVASIPTDLLKAGLPLVLIMIALYFLVAPNPSDIDTRPRLPQPIFNATVIPTIALYDGAAGPGAGSFYTLGLLALRGQSMLRATANAKLLNLASNFGALALFIYAGKMAWLIGITMGAGSIVGALIGARLAIAKGAAVIRPVIVIACCAMATKLLADPAHPVWNWR